MFIGIAHVLTHATTEENLGAPWQAGLVFSPNEHARDVRSQGIFGEIAHGFTHATTEENLGAPWQAGSAFTSTEPARDVRSQGVFGAGGTHILYDHRDPNGVRLNASG